MGRGKREGKLAHCAVRMLRAKVQLSRDSSHHTEISEVGMRGSHSSHNLQVWRKEGNKEVGARTFC